MRLRKSSAAGRAQAPHRFSADAVHEIARRSRGTPRKANNLLRWARDYAQSKSDGRITTSVAQAAFHLQEVDELGLEMQDRRYLTRWSTCSQGVPRALRRWPTPSTFPPTLSRTKSNRFSCGWASCCARRGGNDHGRGPGPLEPLDATTPQKHKAACSDAARAWATRLPMTRLNGARMTA